MKILFGGFKIFIYIFYLEEGSETEGQRERETKKKRKRERERKRNHHLLVHSPNIHSAQGWTGRSQDPTYITRT